ncbi:MAG TPA: LCP family protein [Thermomicrobiales bacterium]|jgi:LCP family protein required for cell wall assembly
MNDLPQRPLVGRERSTPPFTPLLPPQPVQPSPVAPQPQQWGEGLPPDLVYPWDPQQKQRRRPRRFPFGRLLLLILLTLLVALGIRGATFVAAVSTEPLWSAHFWPIADERAANVLIMGYGGQGHEGAYLTDSLLLLHSDLASGKTAQIAVPRDLWVQIPLDSGRYAKINSAYAYGRGEAGDPVAGGRLATTKVGQVTGLPTSRWVTIDFRGFRALVDAVGGVDVDVERAFTAQYPANDDPTIDPSWIEISFAAGRQHMDGEAAIRYARARYSEDPAEGSDFARGQRQARLVAALTAKLKRPTTWPRAFAVMDALQPALKTNLAPADLLVLFLRADTGGATRIRLDDPKVLVNATSADGQAILVPPGNDYGVITRYIGEQIAGR